MDQGVIASMKCHYKADLLRTVANGNSNIIALQKKMTIGCCLWHIAGMAFCESSNTGSVIEETSSRSEVR
jgi:hypothetical protein